MRPRRNGEGRVNPNNATVAPTTERTETMSETTDLVTGVEVYGPIPSGAATE